MLLGEHYCNGIPLSGISGTTIVFGDPISNDSLFKLAIANADSALAIARGVLSPPAFDHCAELHARVLLIQARMEGQGP